MPNCHSLHHFSRCFWCACRKPMLFADAGRSFIEQQLRFARVLLMWSHGASLLLGRLTSSRARFRSRDRWSRSVAMSVFLSTLLLSDMAAAGGLGAWAPAPAPAPSASPREEARICRAGPPETGSRIGSSRICKSRSEWIEHDRQMKEASRVRGAAGDIGAIQRRNPF